MSSLCAVWVDDTGTVHTVRQGRDGKRFEQKEQLTPFAWVHREASADSWHQAEVDHLAGQGIFDRLARWQTLSGIENFLKEARSEGIRGIDVLKPWESQYLLQRQERLFQDIPFSGLRRCQLDIETSSTDGAFSDPKNPDDRILAIGLKFGDDVLLLEIEEETDAGEKGLLLRLNEVLAERDPDTIEGHNIFKFDFDYLRTRARRHKVPCAWGRFGQPARFRSSRLKVAERWVDFPRCDLPGRTVVDTYLLVQLYDITTRELTSYGLKDVAVYFGITEEDDNRTYLPGSMIQEAFRTDRTSFRAYLSDDLRETRGIADLLLPTYFEQTRTFPILFQEATLRGTAGKIDLLFLEKYYHARQACPMPEDSEAFAGGYTRSFQEGVFRHVLHFDVASLYPSLLLLIGRNPSSDSLGVFIPLLKSLREYRLRYKQLARSAPSAEERAEAQARQSSFKILINSFYGYLGFSGARFGDGELAAEVTRRGRELLQALIDAFAAEGCVLLEADTDGIYLSSEKYYDTPEALLAKVSHVLPEGIDLEYDGRYEAMFCYKSKNYALFDGQRITLRGSALRSRGIEPYLKRLSSLLIRYLLGESSDSPVEALAQLRQAISSGTHPVADLAKSEILSQSPEAYERLISSGGKPRRASAEVALLLTPRPRMGERVRYYITPKSKGKTSDWQRARPVELFDAMAAPYAPEYYLKKLDEWVERYVPFLPELAKTSSEPAQGELF